jgi:hypothetical protein
MPHVHFVSVHPLLADLWRLSDPERAAGVSAAAHVACDALAAMVETLEPGVRPRALRSIVAQPMTSAANGSAMRKTSRPRRGRALNQSTRRPAVCAGSYCAG